MGGNVGGPVLLPLVKFNRNRNKLFFWGGYEYMKQQPAGSIINYNVPNAAQLAGDFSNAGIPADAITTWPKFYDQITQNAPAGGTATSIPTSAIDPNIVGILNLYPKPNQTPSSANGYSNYRYVNTSPQNRWEATGKLDYAISDNTKLTGSYAYQKESDLAPISIWWATPNTLPYPESGRFEHRHVRHPDEPDARLQSDDDERDRLHLVALCQSIHARGSVPRSRARRTTSTSPDSSVAPPTRCRISSRITAAASRWRASTTIRCRLALSAASSRCRLSTITSQRCLATHTLKVGFYWDCQPKQPEQQRAEQRHL